MADSMLDYVKVVGRVGLTVGDGSDEGKNPDLVAPDPGGTITFTPLAQFAKVADATPPVIIGNAVITCIVDTEGYLTYNGDRFVWLVDLGSTKVNPRIPLSTATYKVDFNLRFNNTKVSFPSFTCHPITGVDNDITTLAPVPVGAGVPIIVGPTGVGVEDLSVEAGRLVVTFTDGDVVDAGELPVGPGGSNAGVASYIGAAGPTKDAVSAFTVPKTTRPPLAAEVTKGIYARAQPLPGGSSFRALARDPNHTGANGTGRVWGVGSAFAQLGFTDDDGATWQPKAAPFKAGLSVQSMRFSANYVWITISSVANQSGEVWRVKRPTANGNPGGAGTDAVANLWGAAITAGSNGQSLPQATINISNGNYFNTGGGTATVYTAAGPQIVTYTGKTAGTLTGCSGGTGAMATGGAVFSESVRVFALSGGVNGPGGATASGGVNSTFRNACFDIDDAETNAYVGEYGAADTAYQFPGLADGVMAAGTALLYSNNGRFSAQMVGLSIAVAGAAVGGATLTATVKEIVAVGSASEAACLRLATPAVTTVTAAAVTFPFTTYGAGNIPGGPTVYQCANPTSAAPTWTAAKRFVQGKHIHSVRVIGGLPWVGIGDLAPQFKDCGVWVATSLTSPTVWQQRTITPTGGVPKDPINMIPVAINGQGCVICESDSSFRDGPLVFADATGTVNRVLERSCTLPQPYVQTMRQLGIDPTTKNAYWYGTSENGSVGPTSCIWMARNPYTIPVMLEDVGSSLELETAGDAVISNGYFWVGTYRCRIEKYVDQ